MTDTVTPPATLPWLTPLEEAAWPEKSHRRHAILRHSEAYIPDDATHHKITSPSPELPPLEQRLMSPPLRESLELLGATALLRDAGSAIPSDAEAAMLWALLARGLDVDALDAMDAWDIFTWVCLCVAAGMRYSARPVAWMLQHDRATDDGFGPRVEHGSWRRRLADLELRVASYAGLINDLRPPAELGRRALGGDHRGLCRHYATAVQVSFNAVKAVTGRFADVYAVPIIGRPTPWTVFSHAWTWFVDIGTGRIVAVDLTHGDARLDSGRDDTLFNPGFDASALSNVSAFAYSLFAFGATNPDTSSASIDRVLTELMLPQTRRGQATLYHLTRHRIGARLRAYILDALERRGFGETFPGWQFGRDVFDRADGDEFLGTHERFRKLLGPMLDAVTP